MSTDARQCWIDVLNWREGALLIKHPDKTEERITIDALALERGGDSDRGRLCTGLYLKATRLIDSVRSVAVAGCGKHEPVDARDVCYTGPVSDNENVFAHGNITRIETCARCGGERKTNINGGQREEGEWH
jgi:hypothetical protein